jgi:NitT/TauT family transport system substrate-binding protein
MSRFAQHQIAGLIIVCAAALLSPLLGARAVAEQTPASLRLKWLPQAQFIGYYVARAKGYYSDEGIALTINPGGPNIIAENMVASGVDTFGHGGGVASLLQAREKGLPIIGLGMLFQETPYRLVALEKAGVKQFSDLKGKTISTWFTGPQFMVQAMLKANGIEQSDIKLEAQANTMTPFIEGKVDVATVTVYNELLILKRRNVTPAVIFNPADMGINLANEAIIVNESTIQSSPKLVQSFLGASLKGWVYAFAHKEEAMDILLKEVPTLQRTEQMETLEALQPLLTYGVASSMGIGYLDRANLQFAHKFLLDNAALKKAVDIESSINTTFWDKVPLGDKVIPR